MYIFALKARNKGTVATLVVILISLLLMASWHLGAFEKIDLHSHAEVASEYVKQFFNKPGNITEEVAAPKVIAPDAVRIYIGIVRLPASKLIILGDGVVEIWRAHDS